MDTDVNVKVSDSAVELAPAEIAEMEAEVARLTMLAEKMTLAMGHSAKHVLTLEAALRELLDVLMVPIAKRPAVDLGIAVAHARAALAGEPKCQECGGSKQVVVGDADGFGLSTNHYEPCPSCGGD